MCSTGSSAQLFASEMEQRKGEETEHDNAEDRLEMGWQRCLIVGAKHGPKFWPEREKVGAPGKIQQSPEPAGDVGGDFRVLEKIDDDAEQAENAAGGNQSAGIERAGAGFSFVFLLFGTGFDHPTDKATGEHRGGGSDGEIRADSKRERAHAENFNGDDQRDAHQNEAPWKLLVEDAVDDRGHQARLRSGSFVAADALRPLNFDLFCVAVVKIFAVGNYAGAECVDQRVTFAAIDEAFSFDFCAGGKRRNIYGNLRGDVFLEAHVHQVESRADGDGRNCDADKKTQLLTV